MQLQGGAGTDRGERSFDHVLDRAHFCRSERKQETATRVENRADSHRHRVLRHRLERTKHLAVIAQRLFGKNFDPCTRTERTGGLIESDVSVAPKAEELDIDAARGVDAVFVRATLGVKILRDAIRYVRAPDVDVD